MKFNTIKKLFVLLSLVSITGICGCSSNKQTEVENKEEITEDVTEKTDQQEETTATDAADADAVTDVSADGEKEGEDVMSETEVTKMEDGYYFGGLVGDNTDFYVDSGAVKSVVIQGDQMIVTGTLGYGPDRDTFYDMENYDPQILEEGEYTFVITDATECYAMGGDAEPASMDVDRFMQLVQEYNGLGLCIIVENGVIVEMDITS